MLHKTGIRTVRTGKLDMKVIGEFSIDDSGATAVEYSLICALIAVAVIAVFALIGEPIVSLFRTIVGHFEVID